LTTFYDDLGMRCERDAFDTLFDHAPDKLQVSPKTVCIFIGIEISQLDAKSVCIFIGHKLVVPSVVWDFLFDNLTCLTIPNHTY
jgi:hypothetical protein